MDWRELMLVLEWKVFGLDACDSGESVASGIGITLPFQLIVTVMPSDLTYSACNVRPCKSVHG